MKHGEDGDRRELFEQALKGKRIPILTLDNKWYQLLRGEAGEDVAQLEGELNALLKQQGRLNNEVKEIKRLKKRLMEEENPAVRGVLEQECGYLESKQIEMSTARQFLFVLRFTKGEKPEQVFQAINLTEKTISEQGFEVRRLDREDLKRVLGLCFGTSMTGEAVEDVDGAKNFDLNRRPDS